MSNRRHPQRSLQAHRLAPVRHSGQALAAHEGQAVGLQVDPAAEVRAAEAQALPEGRLTPVEVRVPILEACRGREVNSTPGTNHACKAVVAKPRILK